MVLFTLVSNYCCVPGEPLKFAGFTKALRTYCRNDCWLQKFGKYVCLNTNTFPFCKAYLSGDLFLHRSNIVFMWLPSGLGEKL